MNFLQTVLGVDGPLFNAGLAKLEKTTGHSAVDVRLIADMHKKTHEVMRYFGLDTRDTTGRELYMTLIAAVRHEDFENILADTDYTLVVIDGKVISLNMIDVIENAHHQLSYDRQIISHGQRTLRGELVDRYVKHARTDDKTTREIAAVMGLLDIDTA